MASSRLTLSRMQQDITGCGVAAGSVAATTGSIAQVHDNRASS